ncbi:MAG: aminoglycoside phosphotransferase family protein [Chloroflexota bacterium]|nr:aminoglycoside phosphotransferase family protein [Chloroflexota bacterium]
MLPVPDRFSQTIIELYGREGASWLNRLPTLLAHCERRWSLTILPPVANLSYNYITPAITTDGTGVILKLGVPNPELLTEIEMLRLCDGHGIVQLLDADPTLGILLLERLEPGTPLVQVEDDEVATSIAAYVMQQLWRPAPPEHSFPSVADWAAGLDRLRQRYDGTTGPLPPTLVETAETLFAELLSSMADPVLLHGDLHHYNILAAQRQPWLAIDPKGVVGEPAYEVGALLRNPMPRLLSAPAPHRLLARHLDQLAEQLDLDRQRLLAWSLAQAVLSAWWSLEDHGHGWEPAIACAQHLAGLL